MLLNAEGCTSDQVRDHKDCFSMWVQCRGKLSPLDTDASSESEVVRFQFFVSLKSMFLKRNMACKCVFLGGKVFWRNCSLYFIQYNTVNLKVLKPIFGFERFTWSKQVM